MKKNIVVFILGMLVAVAIGYGFMKFRSDEGLVAKVNRKIKNWQFNRAPKATEELVFCDFENATDFSMWKALKAKISATNDHSTRGTTSALVEFEPSGSASAIKVVDYFESRGAVNNWSGYEGIHFTIYNPQDRQERVIVQVKDKKGRTYKENLYLEARAMNETELEMSRIRHAVDIFNIAEFGVFLWQPQVATAFYVDNITLTPYGTKEKKTCLGPDMAETLEAAYPLGNYFDFSAAKSKWLKADAANNQAVEVPFVVANEKSFDFGSLPFAGGVPFPRGELKETKNLELLDMHGKQLDYQSKAMSYWPDDSIKWLFVEMKASPYAESKEGYRLRYGETVKPKEVKEGIIVADDEDSQKITVDTGALKFVVQKKGFNMFEDLWFDEDKDGIYSANELVSTDNTMTIKAKGSEYKSAFDRDSKVFTEEQGPMSVVIKAEGWYINSRGEKFGKYVVRIHAFAHESYLKISHTFIYTGYPENKYHYLYKGRSLPRNEPVEAINLTIPYKLAKEKTFTFEADGKSIQGALSENTAFFQGNYNNFKIIKSGQPIFEGAKSSGWLDVSDSARGISVGIKNFWEQFPKEYYLDRDNDYLIISLWPARVGALDLSTREAAYGPDAVARGSAFGLAKTHEMNLYFHAGDYKKANARKVIGGLQDPLIIRVHPRWVSDTVALGKLMAYDSRLTAAEDTLANLFEWAQRQREKFNWYGMLDFGDTLSWYRGEDPDASYPEPGWNPVGRWGWFNCEGAGTHTAALQQFLRTGESKYLYFGQHLSRHIMDIDTCNFNTVANDPRLKGKIPDDYSQPGSMHRHNGNHWGGRNEEASHTNVAGLVLYYYITGDLRALDVAREVGEFFLKEKITYFKHPDVAPHRGIANILWGDVLMYELTEDPRYKEAADKLADLFYSGQRNNGSWAEDYNPVYKRWDGDPHMMYIVGYTMPALIEYHKMTQNKAIKEALIKATQYLMKTCEYDHPFDAIAYAFWLTGDKHYQDDGQRRVDHLIGHQNRGNDPVYQGMIYQKPYYARVVDFLFRTPYIFEVLAQPMAKQKTR